MQKTKRRRLLRNALRPRLLARHNRNNNDEGLKVILSESPAENKLAIVATGFRKVAHR
jgi:hypothetical protein